MKQTAVLLTVLLSVMYVIHAQAAPGCALPVSTNFPALNGATIPADCADAAVGALCKPTCLTGFTSYPDPVLVCGTDGSWQLQGNIGCNPVCPGSPPTPTDVIWTNVYNVATDTSPTPAQSCADRVPEYNAPGANPAAFVQCVGSCSALFGSPVAKCQRNATSGQLEWVVTKACYSAICDSVPPFFTEGTQWPSCGGTPVGGTCTATCQSEPSFWATGNDTNLFPSVTCVANASDPKGGSWDMANIVGNCVPVAVLPSFIWIRNGAWPTWCDAQTDSNDAFTGKGGLTSFQVCKGVCNPGYYGSPQWVSSPKGKFKSNRTGDCFNGEIGGCFGPVPASTPLNAKAWDFKKCWDMSAGANCTTTCNGDWDTPVTDPAAVGYGTAGLPYLPYIKCVYNASSFYNGSYTAAFGQCEQVCRGPLPALANGRWPDSCLPAYGGLGGLRTNSSKCVATCDAGFSGANGVTPFVTCTGQGWSTLISACQQPPPPNVCVGGVSAPNVAHAAPWPASCANKPAGDICTTTCVDDPANATTGSTWGTSQALTPFVTCQANFTWQPKATGACNRVCFGALPALPSGTWDPLCTRLPGGAGGVRSSGTCMGTCDSSSVGIAKVSCTTLQTGAMAWSTISGTAGGCQSNTMYQGACEGKPNPGPVTNVNQWPCQDLWVGQNCTAKCNPGGSPTVTYASGSPSIPAPTVSCLYDTASLPYFGKWGTTVTGRCIAVCRNGPPAATGVAWPATCTPQADGSGGIMTGAGVCTGSCDTGYNQVGTRAPTIVCSGGTWTSVFNPCVLNAGRRLRTEGLMV